MSVPTQQELEREVAYRREQLEKVAAEARSIGEAVFTLGRRMVRLGGDLWSLAGDLGALEGAREPQDEEER